jgi:hypothetical protein
VSAENRLVWGPYDCWSSCWSDVTSWWWHCFYNFQLLASFEHCSFSSVHFIILTAFLLRSQKGHRFIMNYLCVSVSRLSTSLLPFVASTLLFIRLSNNFTAGFKLKHTLAYLMHLYLLGRIWSNMQQLKEVLLLMWKGNEGWQLSAQLLSFLYLW